MCQFRDGRRDGRTHGWTYEQAFLDTPYTIAPKGAKLFGPPVLNAPLQGKVEGGLAKSLDNISYTVAPRTHHSDTFFTV